MDDPNNESTATATFEVIWQKLPRREDLEAAGTLDTVSYHATLDDCPALPRVDQLVALGALLGAGGNGEVVVAHQMNLDRTIAVKRPLDGAQDAEMSSRLLQEARVIGYLEHPNIPPVHFVGSGEDGTLLVGLKRIEGETLTARLQRDKGLENLDENLDILIHICNAVGYAHDRGVLHLDIKPDNVMTGHFGEVYVLDWGLAAAFREDVPEGIPRRPVDRHIRGTPAFVAPETVVGELSTTATDVYQLGGLLHYMLTHQPPNAGGSAFEAVQSAYEPSSRTFDAEVPEALAAICLRALAYNPQERPADADALRDELSDYRRRRREIDAVATARAQIDQLSRALGEDAAAAAVYQAYGAARQALDEASRQRAADVVTRDLLQAVLEPLIGWELARQNVGSAELLLSELPIPNSELARRCAEQRQQTVSDKAELQSLRQQNDPMVDANVKAILFVSMGVLIGLLELIPFLLGLGATTTRVLTGYVVYVALLTLATIALRRWLLNTRLNRGVMCTIWQLSVFGLLLRIGGFLDVLPLYAVAGYDLALVTTGTLFAAVVFDRRLYYSTPIYGLGAAACFGWPDLALPIFGTTHFVGLSAIGYTIAFLEPVDR